MVRTKRWLPLRQAAALLGVDETTLRHWADLGKVQTFRTPGGHRRFLEGDIRALMAPAARERGDVAAELRRHTLHLVSGLPARRLRAAPWFSGLDEAFRVKAREHGRQVIDLLVQSVGGTADRKEVAGQIRELGHKYGSELRRAGLTLSQATEAFCFFRDLVMARVVQVVPGDEVQVLREVGRMLDQILLAIVRAYEVPEGTAT